MIIDGSKVNLDMSTVPSPCFVVDKQVLENNLAVLDSVQQRTGAKVLLALKGFAMFSVFPLLNKVLAGTCASSIDEALLGRQEFGGEVHTFSAAYSQESLEEILIISDHVVFNSINQWQRFKLLCQNFSHRIEFGLRINPEHSEVDTALYDPCAPASRLGIRAIDLTPSVLSGISGLHFHTLCEQDSYALERTLVAIENSFGAYIHGMKWVNFGGGHHITRPDYDVDHLCAMINAFKKKYNVQVYLEPGEAVALNAGVVESISFTELSDTDLQLTHTFSDGVYCRSGVMPKGTFIIGHKHRNKCVNIMSTGKMRMIMDGEIYDLEAPCIFESLEGSRKAAYIIEDVTFTNVHPTNTTDLDKLREELIIEEEFILTDKVKGLLCGQW